MMTICNSPASAHGEHRYEWTATFDGGGYWRCLNDKCTDAVPENTGHHGG